MLPHRIRNNVPIRPNPPRRLWLLNKLPQLRISLHSTPIQHNPIRSIARRLRLDTVIFKQLRANARLNTISPDYDIPADDFAAGKGYAWWVKGYVGDE